MNEEIWKDIQNYEGLYQISNLGRIKRIKRYNKELFLNYATVYNGYKRVCLSKNGKTRCFRVHRLVAETFLDNPNNLPIINHKDGNKNNNNLCNLEWCTQKDNIIHSWENGLSKPHNTRKKKGK